MLQYFGNIHISIVGLVGWLYLKHFVAVMTSLFWKWRQSLHMIIDIDWDVTEALIQVINQNLSHPHDDAQHRSQNREVLGSNSINTWLCY